MRRRNLSTVVLICAVWLSSVHHIDARPDCEKSLPGEHFAGRLGGRSIQAYLGLGYPAQDDGIFGAFLFPDTWTPGASPDEAAFGIDGEFTDTCEIELIDSGGGIWQLRVADGRLIGTRGERGGQSPAVELKVVPETDCSPRGAWLTFRSQQWPVAFDYPASWRVGEDGRDVVVQCPSAERMTNGGSEIWLQLGQGKEPVVATDGRRGDGIDVFVTWGNDQWLIGTMCEDRASALCQPARKSVRRGMTVLQGTLGEHRLYRIGGGYVGQGPGIMSYLFLLGDAWIRIHSHERVASIEQMGVSGPVIFDGDGVAERLVRSIRPR